MERRNKKTKSVGNGEGTLYYSETLKRWVFQYYDTSGKRQTMKQRKKETLKSNWGFAIKNECNKRKYRVKRFVLK